MDVSLKIQQHEASALREEDAAAFATSSLSAKVHAKLADLHRREIVRLASVLRASSVAFGD